MSWLRDKRMPDGRVVETEVFDPYVSGHVDTLEMNDIFIDGARESDPDKILKVIEFHDVNHDGFSSGKGCVTRVFLDGERVK